MATDPKQPPVDDRVITFTVRYHPDGPKVEGGFNSFWEHLPKEKKRAIFYAAVEALAACGAQLVGNDDLLAQILAIHDKDTH